jgi:hypothetical protein
MNKACHEPGRMNESIIPAERIEQVIYMIRGQKVILDHDLAVLYDVETKALNQAVKRNIERFPEDFMFQLSEEELEYWRSQIVTSNLAAKMSLRRRPYAFTEQGVAMLSGVLRSPQAVAVNIEIMRTFIRIRHALNAQKEMGKELADLKAFMLKHSHVNDREFKRIWQAIEKLSSPKDDYRKIGFRLDQ